MAKKVFSVVGMVLCALLILVGILTLCGELGGNSRWSNGSHYGFDSGFATFGSDYYTYSNNNAAAAADGAVVAANNASGIADLLKNVFGWGMIFSGAIVFCAFGVVLSGCPKLVKQPFAPSEIAYSQEDASYTSYASGEDSAPSAQVSADYAPEANEDTSEPAQEPAPENEDAASASTDDLL